MRGGSACQSSHSAASRRNGLPREFVVMTSVDPVGSRREAGRPRRFTICLSGTSERPATASNEHDQVRPLVPTVEIARGLPLARFTRVWGGLDRGLTALSSKFMIYDDYEDSWRCTPGLGSPRPRSARPPREAVPFPPGSAADRQDFAGARDASGREGLRPPRHINLPGAQPEPRKAGGGARPARPRRGDR